HRAVGVGQEHLIDRDADLLTGLRLAGDEMNLDELTREALTHGSPLVDGDPGAAAGADVVAAGPDQPIVVVLLDDVGRPAGDAPGGDDRREEVDWNAERVEERRRVEVDVGDELLRLVHAGVEFYRHLVPLELAGLTARLLGHPLENGGAWIARLVD